MGIDGLAETQGKAFMGVGNTSLQEVQRDFLRIGDVLERGDMFQDGGWDTTRIGILQV
jgi:hypothetical protein